MAELQLFAKEKIRVTTDYTNEVFINVESLHGEDGMAIDFSSINRELTQPIEVRQKMGGTRLFIFKSNHYKNDFDFGWWEDAKIIYSTEQQRSL